MRVQISEAALAAAVLNDVQKVCMKAAEAGRDGAKRRARVDTGRMRDSIEAVPVDGSGAKFGSSVEYTWFNEFGTRRMSAQPMMRPAVNDAAAAL